MATYKRPRHPRTGRIDQLYDRLASVLRRLKPNRQEAFAELLNDQSPSSTETNGTNQRQDETAS